jgi:hypothetical protein
LAGNEKSSYFDGECYLDDSGIELFMRPSCLNQTAKSGKSIEPWAKPAIDFLVLTAKKWGLSWIPSSTGQKGGQRFAGIVTP